MVDVFCLPLFLWVWIIKWHFGLSLLLTLLIPWLPPCPCRGLNDLVSTRGHFIALSIGSIPTRLRGENLCEVIRVQNIRWPTKSRQGCYLYQGLRYLKQPHLAGSCDTGQTALGTLRLLRSSSAQWQSGVGGGEREKVVQEVKFHWGLKEGFLMGCRPAGLLCDPNLLIDLVIN